MDESTTMDLFDTVVDLPSQTAKEPSTSVLQTSTSPLPFSSTPFPSDSSHISTLGTRPSTSAAPPSASAAHPSTSAAHPSTSTAHSSTSAHPSTFHTSRGNKKRKATDTEPLVNALTELSKEIGDSLTAKDDTRYGKLESIGNEGLGLALSMMETFNDERIPYAKRRRLMTNCRRLLLDFDSDLLDEGLFD